MEPYSGRQLVASPPLYPDKEGTCPNVKLPQTKSTGRAASHNSRQRQFPTGLTRTELGRPREFGNPHNLTQKNVDFCWPSNRTVTPTHATVPLTRRAPGGMRSSDVIIISSRPQYNSAVGAVLAWYTACTVRQLWNPSTVPWDRHDLTTVAKI